MLIQRVVQGIVISRSAGKLSILPSESCTTSSSCGEGCTSCGGKQTTSKLTVAISDTDRFPIGSRVEVATWTVNEALGALIVFGIPLLFGIGALLIRYIIAPSTIESALSLIGAACAFTVGGVFVAIIDRLFRHRYPSSVKTIPSPTITIPRGDAHHG